MSDANEPLAAVLAEMRDRAGDALDSGYTGEARDMLSLADRIETAAEREREAYCDLCKDKDATIDRLLVERDRAIKARAAAKWLYRLEYHDGTCGLWYDGSGNWCFERGIGSLDDSCKTKSLPMDYDERYRQDGRAWFSSCSRKEDLLHWYSREDAKRLLSHGFVFTRYLATEYREYDQQTVFIKETCLYREEIDFESLWKSTAPGNAAAMREALEFAEDELWAYGAFDSSKRVAAALAAPARNVDRFNNATEAGLAYRNFLWERAGRVVDIDENMFFAHLVNWLFAKAEGGKE